MNKFYVNKIFDDGEDSWLSEGLNAWPMVYHCINDK